jgi:hypothetical protein
MFPLIMFNLFVFIVEINLTHANAIFSQHDLKHKLLSTFLRKRDQLKRYYNKMMLKVNCQL